ncbi:MAG: GTP-binding protein [Alphaproteobacteria bacterium]
MTHFLICTPGLLEPDPNGCGLDAERDQSARSTGIMKGVPGGGRLGSATVRPRLSARRVCKCCTLRDDLLQEDQRLAEDGRFDDLLIESTGICEPRPVAAPFDFRIFEQD